MTNKISTKTSGIVFTGKKSSALSFTRKLKEGLQTIKEEKQIAKLMEGIVLLLDVSGSMSEFVDGKPKIDHLREVIVDYPGLKKVSFSSRVYEDAVPNPHGTTAMDRAFDYLRTMNMKITQVILVSDGLPDDSEAALAAAKSLNVPVNVVYIGPGGDSGEEFMKRLAAETGGRQVTVDTQLFGQNFGKQLADKIKLMLPNPK